MNGTTQRGFPRTAGSLLSPDAGALPTVLPLGLEGELRAKNLVENCGLSEWVRPPVEGMVISRSKGCASPWRPKKTSESRKNGGNALRARCRKLRRLCRSERWPGALTDLPQIFGRLPSNFCFKHFLGCASRCMPMIRLIRPQTRRRYVLQCDLPNNHHHVVTIKQHCHCQHLLRASRAILIYHLSLRVRNWTIRCRFTRFSS